MAVKRSPALEIGTDLTDAMRGFPMHREIEHCGVRVAVDAFDKYATCSQCGSRIKVRSFAAIPEIEDVFDAVFE
jgi:hypothetical protein